MPDTLRVANIPELSLLRTGDILGPCAQARPELVRPLVRRFEDHSTAFPTHQNLPLSSEPTVLRKADNLTTAVPEQLGACGFHDASLDVSLYVVKFALPLTGLRFPLSSQLGTATARLNRPYFAT